MQKFGGTSVFGIERIKASASIVKQNIAAGNKIVVVVSAMAGETDKLINLYKEACFNGVEKKDEMDAIVSTGEQACAGLFACVLNNIGVKARSFTGVGAGIITDDSYTKAKIKGIIFDEVLKAMEEGFTPVITGFQGFCLETLRQTTLGRGGSDTSALAIAAFLKADKCEIYKDVEGVLTGDPSFVKGVKKIDALNYDSMLEIAGAGTKVLEIKSVNFAAKYGIKTEVKSSFNGKVGTEIEGMVNEKSKILNISLSEKESLVQISTKDFETLEKSDIEYKVLHINAQEKAEVLIARSDATKLKIGKTEDVIQISIIGTFLKSDKVFQKALSMIKEHGGKVVFALSFESKIVLFLKSNTDVKLKALYNQLHSECIEIYIS